MGERKRIRFHNVFNDGCEVLTFVHCEHPHDHRIAYALTDEGRETHTQVYEAGVQEGFLDEDIEPSGGGVFDAQTGKYIRGSIHYGSAEDAIINMLDRKLPSLIDCG